MIEGKRCIKYHVVDCPYCRRTNLIDNKTVFDMPSTYVSQVNCSWCFQTFTYDFYAYPGIPQNFYIETNDDRCS